MYGWTAEEVLGRTRREVARTGDELRGAGRGAPREWPSTGAGVARWSRTARTARRCDVELITVALRGERGGITGYLGIHRDMSERKRAEEDLREARRRSEAILESISDEFFALDREWRYTFVNERGLAEIGRIPGRNLGAADLLGRTVWEVFPELVGTTFDHEAHRALREQAVVEFETRSPVTGRWMDVRLYPSEAGLSIYLHDITERKRAEEELRRRAEQQALVAELGRRALASDDLQWVLEEAVGLLVRTLGVELACVAELPADRDEVILRAGVGWREGYIGRRFERGRDSQVGYTLLRGEPVIAEDQANDPRFKRSALADEHGAVSALTVMIESPDEPFGVLEALSTRRRSFSPSEVSFVQAVANVLASAVERSRAHERLLEVRGGGAAPDRARPARRGAPEPHARAGARRACPQRRRRRRAAGRAVGGAQERGRAAARGDLRPAPGRRAAHAVP